MYKADRLIHRIVDLGGGGGRKMERELLCIMCVSLSSLSPRVDLKSVTENLIK